MNLLDLTKQATWAKLTFPANFVPSRSHTSKCGRSLHLVHTGPQSLEVCGERCKGVAACLKEGEKNDGAPRLGC